MHIYIYIYIYVCCTFRVYVGRSTFLGIHCKSECVWMYVHGMSSQLIYYVQYIGLITVVTLCAYVYLYIDIFTGSTHSSDYEPRSLQISLSPPNQVLCTFYKGVNKTKRPVFNIKI